MAKDLEMATGSIGGHLDKLLTEELIEGAKASPKVTLRASSTARLLAGRVWSTKRT